MTLRTGSSSPGDNGLNRRASSFSTVISFLARPRHVPQSIELTVRPGGAWGASSDIDVTDGGRECPRGTAQRVDTAFWTVRTDGASISGIRDYTAHRTVVAARTLVAPFSGMLHSIGARVTGRLATRSFHSIVTRLCFHLGLRRGSTHTIISSLAFSSRI